jgi:kinesin family member 5
MSGQINELRLQVERLTYDNKEGTITIDILKEQNQDTKNELEELKKQIAEVKSSQKDASAEEKERKKQEKMAVMMAKFDTQGAFSEKDEQLRAILVKLEAVDSDADVTKLTAEDLTTVRRQLADGQTLLRETVDRLRHTQEENEVIVRRRDELEERVKQLEEEYEELLGMFHLRRSCVFHSARLRPVFPALQRRPSMMRRRAMLILRSRWLNSR